MVTLSHTYAICHVKIYAISLSVIGVLLNKLISSGYQHL